MGEAEPTQDAQKKSDSVRVAVRVRPLNARELAYGTDTKSSWAITDTSVTQCLNTKKIAANHYTFDNVFQQQSTNSHIFSTVAQPVVKSAVDGINGVIFAYGQTAAGKTYTMLGTEDDWGVTRRSIAAVFDEIAQMGVRQFLMRASYIEIYNELIRDLIVPGNDNLKIHEDVLTKRVFVDAREEVVTTVQQVMDIIQAGETARAVGETNMNERSSRSHTIFTLKIESREISSSDAEEDVANMQTNGVSIRASTLSLVDLAGSERASFTKAQGMRLVEGGHINKSLLTLGTVINKLSSGESSTSTHIPYRDSKLTRLLQPALGGNARTAIICAVTPALLHMEETLSTLKFASRAKKVTNSACANEFLDDRAKLRRAEKQIASLKSEVAKLKDAGVGQAPSDVTLSSTDSKLLREVQLGQTEARIHAFEKKFEKLMRRVSCNKRASAKQRRRGSDVLTPSLAAALDLSSSQEDLANGKSAVDENAEKALADMRNKVMAAEKERRQAMSEIQCERDAMLAEVNQLVATSEESVTGRIAAEHECDDALRKLARAQAASLVDELVSEAMTSSFLSVDLKEARKSLKQMDVVTSENKSIKEQFTALKKEYAEMARREKRGIGPVLKEAKLAQGKLADCENKLKSARQTASKVASERAALEREMKDRDRKMKALNSELDKHRNHKEKGKERVSKAIMEEKKKFEISLAEEKKKYGECLGVVRGEISELQRIVKLRDEELKARGEQVERLEGEMAQAEQAKAELAEEAETAKVSLAKFKEEWSRERDDIVSTSQTEKDLMRTEIEEKKERIGKLTGQLGMLQLELEETKCELRTLHDAHEEGMSDLMEIQALYERSDIDLTSTKQTLEDVQSANAESKAQVERFQSMQAENAREIEQTRQIAAELQRQLSEKQTEISQAHDKMAGLEEVSRERGTICETLEESVRMADASISRLENDIANMQQGNDEIQEKYDELRTKYSSLKSQECLECRKLQTELDAAKEGARKQDAVRRSSCVNPLSAVEDVSMKQLRMDNAMLGDQVEQLLSETTTRAREVLKLSQIIRARDNKIYTLESGLDKLARGEGIIWRLKERVNRRDLMIHDLNKRVTVLQALLKGDMSECYESSQHVCGVEAENMSLRRERDGLKEQIVGMEQEMEVVRVETRKLRDAIKQRDVGRVERAVDRKERKLGEVREGNRRRRELREIDVNGVEG